ncbi:LysR family transcriptional regulator [Pseudoduganella flava]|uniref:LysR family transcriptional regulator n=1 Tax=Pseudoduganella flava TaxID=871742 RepID=UPI0035315530
MSRRLGAMEARLGVRLIDRHARRFQLTEEGALLHERARRILAEVDEAEAEASAGGTAPRGSLRMICPVHIWRVRIAGRWHVFPVCIRGSRSNWSCRMRRST